MDCYRFGCGSYIAVVSIYLVLQTAMAIDLIGCATELLWCAMMKNRFC